MYLAIVQSALVWVSFVCGVLALIRWTKYTLSRSLLGVGWFCLFFAPFVISIVPMRYFLNLDHFHLTQQWLDELYTSSCSVPMPPPYMLYQNVTSPAP